MLEAHTIPFLHVAIMNPGCAYHGSNIAEKYRSLLGVKSRFHNISLDQTLYHFPAALVSSSAEDKGEKGGEKRWWRGGISTSVLLPLPAGEL